MGFFSYKAADASGKVVTGTLDVPTERDAASRVQEMGFIPMEIRRTDAVRASLDWDMKKGLARLFSRVSPKDVLRFTLDLSTLLKAGLPVDRSLMVLTDTFPHKTFQDAVREVRKAVQGGADLSGALSRYPHAFSEFYVNMVRAGEAGGVLDPVLERLGQFLESAQELKDYIKSSLVYPVFLAGVGGVSVIILMAFVIPRFSVIFSDMGGAIPLSTRILLQTSAFLKAYGFVVMIFLAAGLFFLSRYTRTPSGRLKTDGFLLKAPLFSNLIRQLEAARFARTLGTLIKSGVPILQALDLVKDVIGNRIISEKMGTVRDRVKEGDRLAGPLREIGVFPALAIQMITVGEESGRLGDMLLRVAETYEKMVRNMVKRLVSLIEPVMILFMGLVVGFIVISMLLAIFSMNEMPF